MERFWSKVCIEGPNDCWEWQAFTHNGYGRFFIEGKAQRAHRVAWELYHGTTPIKYILHSCDNRGCVNPNHLRQGTRKDNTADAISRDRFARQIGESNANARLSEYDVSIIRDRLTGGEPGKSIAYEYGIGQSAISKIRHRRTWNHV